MKALLLVGSCVAVASASAPGETVSELMKLEHPTDPVAFQLGASVAINEYAIAVGAPGAADPHTLGLSQTQLYTPDGMTQTLQYVEGEVAFGASVALEGPWLYSLEGYSGRLHVIDTSNGEELDLMEVADGGIRSMAVHQGRVLVGAPNSLENSGLAHLLRVGVGEVRQLSLAPGEAPAAFGQAVAMNAHTAVITSEKTHPTQTETPAAYVYNTSDWSLRFKLEPPDPSVAFSFGNSVAMNEHRIYVRAPTDSFFTYGAGAVYVYDVDTGAHLETLYSPQPRSGGRFGYDIAVDGERLLVSALREETTEGHYSGAAYLINTVTNNVICRYVPSDLAVEFGESVALHGELAVIGASVIPFNLGAAYLFEVDRSGSGDLNGDGCVSGVDLAIMLAGWGGPDSDLNGDGVVGTSDLAILLAAWGGC